MDRTRTNRICPRRHRGAAWAEQKRIRAYWSEGIRFTDGTTGPAGVFASVHWSADGTQDGLPSRCRRDLPALRQNVQLAIPEFQLVRTGFFPSYSPDGRQLASTTPASGLRHVPGCTSRRRTARTRASCSTIPTQSALAPAWAPTGDRIAFGLGAFFPTPRRYSPAQIAI